MTGVLRNRTPERRTQCRAAARQGGYQSGVTRRRRRSLRTPSPRARVNRTGPGQRPPRPFFCPPENASSPHTPKDQDLDLKILKAAASPPRIRAERTKPPHEPFRNPIKTLRAVAYRGLEHRIDFGGLRENLKEAWYRVMAEPLTVADVERLDGLLTQAQSHRRKRQCPHVARSIRNARASSPARCGSPRRHPNSRCSRC